MPQYRSRTTTAGRNMAGARALWRATGMKDDDFSKPIMLAEDKSFLKGHLGFGSFDDIGMVTNIT